MSDSLMHHGVKGQKWGVRRYQNKDGTRTSVGKEHRSAAKYADKIYSNARMVEPIITKDVSGIVDSTSAKMHGLKNRLKTIPSLTRKIETDAYNDETSFYESASKVKDSIRYTALSQDKDFTKNYFKIKQRLENKGYEEIRCRNYFDLYKKGKVKHKSVQSVFKDPNGQIFELQFHTPSSQDAKDKKLPLYEEARKTGISRDRLEELESEMDYLANNVSTPPKVFSIKSHD